MRLWKVVVLRQRREIFRPLRWTKKQGIVVLDTLRLRLTFTVPALWRLHRKHHADLEFDVTTGQRFHPVEANGNYGFNLLWLDRLQGTYGARTARGHQAMKIGIERFRARQNLCLDWMQAEPVRGPASGHVMNVRKEWE